MRHVIEVSLDNQGHIVIPAALRDRLDLYPGITLVVEKGDNDDMCLRTQPEQPMLVDKEGVLVIRAEPLGDLTDVTRRERDRRVFDLLQRTGL
jgi:AbrB family looped-hinge helix DNA binding protein